MREILEELYYGNTTPCDRQIRSGTSLMKAMEQPQECEEKLTKLPEGEAHSLLLRLINAENEIGSTLTLENFILGFRLGTRLILESLDVRTMAVYWNCSKHPVGRARPATQIKDKTSEMKPTISACGV